MANIAAESNRGYRPGTADPLATPTNEPNRRLPFLRSSFLRVGLSVRRTRTPGQVGNSREDASIDRVLPREIARAVAIFDAPAVTDDGAGPGPGVHRCGTGRD